MWFWWIVLAKAPNIGIGNPSAKLVIWRIGYGKTLHMGRILRPSTHRTVVIAVDHGNFAGPLAELEDPVQVIRLAIEGGADAILANPGTIRKAADEIAGRIGVIARLDGAHTIVNPDKA